MSGTAFSRLIMLFASILVASFLGANLFGQWGVIRSTVTIFTTFLSFGFGVTAMKHLAENKILNPEKASKIFSISLFAALFFGLVLSLLMFFLSEELAINLLNNQEIILPLKISSFYLFATAFSGVFSGALMGLNAYKGIAFANLIVSIISAPIIVLASYYYQVLGVSLGYLVYYCLLGISYFPILYKELKKADIHLTFKGLNKEIPLLYKFSFPAMISGAIGGPVVWIANVIVARMTNGFTIIGIFNAAKIAQNTVIEIGTQVHNPLITLISANKTKRSNAISYFIPALFVTIFILPIAFFPEIIEMMFKNADYLNPKFSIVISITMITGYIIVFKQSLGRSIIIGNRVWWGVYENILWSVVLLSIITSLTFHFQEVGLAIAFFIAYFVDIYVIFPFYSKAGMAPSFVLFDKRFTFAFSTIMLAPVLLYFNYSIIVRIIIFLFSIIAHYFYLTLFRKNVSQF